MKKITYLKTLLLAVVLLVGNGMAWGATVTYTISAKNTLTTTGTAPSGSTATMAETYSTSKQMTSGNSQTLTLSGYSGYKLTSITLSMKSNASAGAGNFIYKIDGGIDNTIIATNTFNNAAWYGAWSGTYVNVIKAVDITCGITSTVLKIATTVNSLYCQTYSLTYEATASCTTPSYSFATPTSVSKLTTDVPFNNVFTSDNTSAKVYNSSNTSVATVNSSTGEVTIVAAGTTTISVTQITDGTYCAVSTSYALTVSAPTKPEPSNHATSFTATTNSSSQITVTWTDATGAQVPDGYLVKASTTTPTAPTDGTAEADAALVKNITQGTQSAVFTGLLASTTYNFSIWPYTNSGVAINYKVGSEPTGNATTETPLGVAVATTATAVTTTGFTANWGTTTSATSYDVNVYTKTGSSTTSVLSENFNLFVAGTIATPDGTDIFATLDTYTQTTGWTGSKVYQAAGTIKMGTSSVLGSIITPSLDLTGANVTLEFKAMGWTGDATTINVLLDGVSIATPTIVADQATWTTISFPITGGTASSKITFQSKQASKGRFFLDDVTITKGGFTLSPISGSPFNVSTIFKVVTGLNPGTEYFYTVVAKNASTSAAASNEISVTTLIPTFTGTGDWSSTPNWNTGVVPGNTDNVVVDGAVTLSSNVEVAGLTINSGKSLTVNAAKQLTVTGALANNGTLNLLSTVAGTATLTAGTVSGSGTANVSQYLADARNWYVSSPVTAAAAPSGFTYYQRDEAGASWTSQPFVATNTFVRGKGYIALPGSAGATLTFSGQLNVENVTVPLTWSGASSKGFNLIGNPYPSHLTWTKAFTDANALLIEPSIYYRTNAGTVNNSSQWSNPTYNAFSGASVLGATGIIPPMQAVWVRAIAAGSLTLDSKLTRSHQGSNPLKAPAANALSQNLRLVVSDGQSSDEMLVYFNENASNAYDAYDSPKMLNGINSTVPDMYTMVGTEQLVINGLKTIPTEIPLYFKANASTAGLFSLSATEISNFEVGTQIYIKNNKTGDQQLISDGTVFNFDTKSEPSLSIIIKAPGAVTGLESNSSAGLNVFANAKGQITVATSSIKGNEVVTVYNAVGQRLLSQTLTSTHTVLNKIFTSGVYVVKVNDISRKIIVE